MAVSLSHCIDLINENSFCVLSTSKNNLPNSSLMLYLSEEEGKTFYMMTQRGSLKSANVVENPEVSLLIDTREKALKSPGLVRALTVYGTATFINDKEEENQLLTRLTQKHPSLSAFSLLKDTCILKVTAKKFLYLNGIEDAAYYTLSGS